MTKVGDIESPSWKTQFSRFFASTFNKKSYRSQSVVLSEKDFSIVDDSAILRGKWSNRTEFLLSCIGFAVGLGNVWRFPIRCYESGGGAFLLLYLLVSFLLGVPLLFIELGLGQFSGRSPTTAFKLVPIFYGVGWAMIIISAVIEVYYAVVISWGFLYMFGSFESIMSWTVCNHAYNSFNCLDSITNKSSRNYTDTYVSSTSEYWDYYVTGFIKYPSRQPYTMNESPGFPKWHVTLCLLLTWIITGLSIMCGIRFSGKVMYFSVLYPYVALIALIIVGCTLPGAMNGIYFYLVPNWSKIYDPNVILGATEQLFFSTSIAMGGMLTYASFNNFRDNIYRDTYLIIFADFLTSFMSGFAIFPILGYMADRAGVPIEKVITSGEGLFYITCTEALATLPYPNLWTFLFMLMAVTLGLDSQFAPLECIATGIGDKYPALRSTEFRRILLIWFIVFLHFIAGIMLCSPGGKYWFMILDSRLSTYGLPFVALLEVLIIGIIYGFAQWRYDIRMMMGFSLNIVWVGIIVFVCPAALFAILIASIVKFEKMSVNDITVPLWAEVVAFIFLLLSMIPILGGIIHTIVTYKRKYPELKGLEFIKKLFNPPVYWGPSNLKYWLLGKFYREKLLKYKDDPKFLKYRSAYDDIEYVVWKAQKGTN